MLKRLLCATLTVGLLWNLAAAAATTRSSSFTPRVQVEAKRINAVQMHTQPYDSQDLIEIEELSHERGRQSLPRCHTARALHPHHEKPDSEAPPRLPRSLDRAEQAKALPPRPSLGLLYPVVSGLDTDESLRHDHHRLKRIREKRKRLEQKLQNERLKQKLLQKQRQHQMRLEENKHEQEEPKTQQLQQSDQQKLEQLKLQRGKADEVKLEKQILKVCLNQQKCQNQACQRHSSTQKEVEHQGCKKQLVKQTRQLEQQQKLFAKAHHLEKKLRKLQETLSKTQQVSKEGEKKPIEVERVKPGVLPVKEPVCYPCGEQHQTTGGRNCCPQRRCLSQQWGCTSQPVISLEEEPSQIDNPHTQEVPPQTAFPVPPQIALPHTIPRQTALPQTSFSQTVPRQTSPPQIIALQTPPPPQITPALTTPPQPAAATTEVREEELPHQHVHQLLGMLRQTRDQLSYLNQSQSEGMKPSVNMLYATSSESTSSEATSSTDDSKYNNSDTMNSDATSSSDDSKQSTTSDSTSSDASSSCDESKQCCCPSHKPE